MRFLRIWEKLSVARDFPSSLPHRENTPGVLKRTVTLDFTHAMRRFRLLFSAQPL